MPSNCASVESILGCYDSHDDSFHILVDVKNREVQFYTDNSYWKKTLTISMDIYHNDSDDSSAFRITARYFAADPGVTIKLDPMRLMEAFGTGDMVYISCGIYRTEEISGNSKRVTTEGEMFFHDKYRRNSIQFNEIVSVIWNSMVAKNKA